MELTVRKESVVIEEIKEVEPTSRRAQFIHDRNYNRFGLQPRVHTPSRLSVTFLLFLHTPIASCCNCNRVMCGK